MTRSRFSDDKPPGLETHELEILELVARGMTTNEIARELCLSRQAVTYHLGHMLAKTGTANRTALVALAYASAILRPGVWPPRLNQ